jgi:hypothetical protein
VRGTNLGKRDGKGLIDEVKKSKERERGGGGTHLFGSREGGSIV